MFCYLPYLPRDLKITALLFAVLGILNVGYGLWLAAMVGGDWAFLVSGLWALLALFAAYGLIRLYRIWQIVALNLCYGAVIMSTPMLLYSFGSQFGPNINTPPSVALSQNVVLIAVQAFWVLLMMLSVWMICVLHRPDINVLFKNAKITKQEWSAASAETEEES
mgnify:CR=1 FL=1